MQWPESLEPARMERVAVVACDEELGAALGLIADAGVFEPDLALFERTRGSPDDPTRVTVEDVSTTAYARGEVAGVVGWLPANEVENLSNRLAGSPAALVRLPAPKELQPPTLERTTGATGAFQPLVDTYSVVPYADVNPSVAAGLAYVAMFGMMFGDVGHGLLLLAAGCGLRSRRLNPSRRFRSAVPFVIGAGLCSAAFGLAFGEAFGPTGLVPTLWLAPLQHPTTLLAVAVAIGGALLGLSFVLATINRWREGGPKRAIVAFSGLAGAGAYFGLAAAALGSYRHLPGLILAGLVLAATGLALGFAGFLTEAGGRATGAVQASVETFDAVVRLGTNTVSFARLAAFGLTHAALSAVIWRGTTVLWHLGGGGALMAALLFAVGNALAFLLEALVAAVQAMRLEYYELFSRIFSGQGRRFRPWHVPFLGYKEAP